MRAPRETVADCRAVSRVPDLDLLSPADHPERPRHPLEARLHARRECGERGPPLRGGALRAQGQLPAQEGELRVRLPPGLRGAALPER